jgi:hypothetical protein
MNEVEEKELIAKFKPGVKVRHPYDRENIGVVVANRLGEHVEEDEEVTVQWDGDLYDVESIYELRVVDPEHDHTVAERIQAKIRETETAFEIAFKAWQEVQDMANEDSDMYTLKSSGLIDVSSLENLVEANGWSVSSMHC